MNSKPRLILVAVTWLVAGGAVARGRAATVDDATRAEGRVLYDRYCGGCHGVAGDGRGAAAEMLISKPRDFTKGIFKFRTTPTGSLPTDDDLLRVLTRGVYRTSMPEWSLLPDRQKRAIVAWLKTFYPEWETRGAGQPIALPRPPTDLPAPERVARGRDLYALLECSACHGQGGRGDGPSARTLSPDAWGNPQVPFDFTKGRLKSGAGAEDIYRTFMTGLNGTAMPSYADIFAEPDGENIKEGDAWSLVAYILSLRTPMVAARKEHP